jgi:hypothetical protein
VTRVDVRTLIGVALLGLLLASCSVQSSGMQSPVLHDYGPVSWVVLENELEQTLIVGTGYSAAIENDPNTSPEVFLERLSALPSDATSGELTEIRIGLRLTDNGEGPWQTGTRIQLERLDFPGSGEPEVVIEFDVDGLLRSGERVIISDLPELDAGEVISVRLLPGDGVQSGLVEVGLTTSRAPYAGWKATSGGVEQAGALVFETRYVRDVSLSGVVAAAWSRFSGRDIGFLTLWGIAIGGLIAGIGVVYRRQGWSEPDGR